MADRNELNCTGRSALGEAKVELRRLFGDGDCHWAAVVAALEQENFSSPWTKAMLERALTDETKFFYAAVDGDMLLGYIGGQLFLDEMEIFNVAVESACRGRHIGDCLVAALCAAATEAGAVRVSLEVRVGNEAAIALYRKHGFIEVGRRKNYYEKPREDAILMDLCL